MVRASYQRFGSINRNGRQVVTQQTKIETLKADEIMHVSGGNLWPWLMNTFPSFNPPWRSTETTTIPGL